MLGRFVQLSKSGIALVRSQQYVSSGHFRPGLLEVDDPDDAFPRSRAMSRNVSSHKVDFDGHQIHYEKVGSGNHVVLLLPGALGCSKTDFKPQIENLNKDKFTVIAWDPPGYGQSRPPDRTWPQHFLQRDAEAAGQLMQNIGVSKYSLVGWSDGGITGLIIAAMFPESIHKLVVWGANAHITKEDSTLYETMRDIDTWSERMRQPFIDVYGEKYFREHWNNWVTAFNKYYTERNGDICKSEVKEIQCPTLIVHGQKDAMVAQHHAEYLNENIAKSRLVMMEDGKHNLHLRYYREFNNIIEDFLTSMN